MAAAELVGKARFPQIQSPRLKSKKRRKIHAADQVIDRQNKEYTVQ
jgi:hypothetical protein